MTTQMTNKKLMLCSANFIDGFVSVMLRLSTRPRFGISFFSLVNHRQTIPLHTFPATVKSCIPYYVIDLFVVKNLFVILNRSAFLSLNIVKLKPGVTRC